MLPFLMFSPQTKLNMYVCVALHIRQHLMSAQIINRLTLTLMIIRDFWINILNTIIKIIMHMQIRQNIGQQDELGRNERSGLQ